MEPTKLLATLQNIIEGTASEEETQLASALFSNIASYGERISQLEAKVAELSGQQPPPESTPDSEPEPTPEPEPTVLSGIVSNVRVDKRADESGYDLMFDGVEGATGYELAYTSPSLGKWEKIEFQETSLFVPADKLPPDQVTYAIIAVNELGRAQDAEGKDLFSPNMTF